MKESIFLRGVFSRLISPKKKEESASERTSVAAVRKQEVTPLFALAYTAKHDTSASRINRFMGVAFAISLAYALFTYVYPLLRQTDVAFPVVTEEKTEELQQKPRSQEKQLEAYVQAAMSRQIFGVPLSIEAKTPQVTSGGNTGAEAFKDLSLVGVIAGTNPQAVIENKKTQKTYTVVKGQFIGEAQVQDIQEGKIVLSYKGQTFEIQL